MFPGGFVLHFITASNFIMAQTNLNYSYNYKLL